MNSKTSETLRENLKSLSDDLGVHRSIRDPILASIRGGYYPDHSDTWAPLAYSNSSTLWDYLPENHTVIWSDELSSNQEWNNFLLDQKRLQLESAGSEIIAPPVESLFQGTESLIAALHQKTRIFFDRVELTTAATLHHTTPNGNCRVDIQGNGEFTQGSRHSLGDLEPQFRLWLKQGFKILLLASTQSQLERIRFLLEERNIHCQQQGDSKIEPQAKGRSEVSSQPDSSQEAASFRSGVVHLAMGDLTEGFRWTAEGWIILTESEILGAKHTKKRSSAQSSGKTTSKDWAGLQALSDLAIGDAIVHVDHGIGRYQGLVRLSLSGAPSDFLLLEYANKDRLYLPVYRLNVIQKYVGAGESVALDRLGSQQFAKTKEKVRDAVKKLAIDLVQLYAERKIHPGFALLSSRC